MAVLSGFYESHGPTPLGDARSIVPAHRHSHQNVSKVDTYCIVIFFCCPGGHRGNTEQVVTRWRRLVAFMKALDLLHLHRAMCAV